LTHYLLQKLLALIAVQFGITVIVFFMIRLVPGDIVDYLFGLYMNSSRMDEIRALWGLDRPLIVQYLEWVARLVQFDFGRSILTGRPIVDDIARRFPVTLELSLMAAGWGVPVGVGMGVLAAWRPYGKLDGFVTSLTLLGLATPHFWLATLLILLFAVNLHWLPAVGYVPFASDPLGSLHSLVLPCLALGTTMAAAVMRMTRSAMLEVLSLDYVRTARAKGVHERNVLSRHALKNAMIPVLTLVGTETGKLLGGSLIVEQIFAIPGIGQYAVNSIFSRDYPVLQAAVLVVASSYVVINTLVDIGYAVVDPRVKYA
jgi:peptide/nickel transport system permease protein